MKIVYCADPIQDEQPDAIILDEVEAARRAGLDYVLIHYEALTDEDNAARAVRNIPVHTPHERAIYRGWPMRAEHYTRLYEALFSRGLHLISTPEAYQYCQHLPASLPAIKDLTPRTVWMHTRGPVSIEAVMILLQPFAGRPVIVRDFSHALKHYWHQACYIASASDEQAVARVVNEFLRLRGEDLVGGLVFREYIHFAPLFDQVSSGKPLIQEFRIFYLHSQPIAQVRYWDVPDYASIAPPVEVFSHIAEHIASPFFTMDVARREGDDRWMILELGDAQVASLPPMANLDQFYQAVAKTASA